MSKESAQRNLNHAEGMQNIYKAKLGYAQNIVSELRMHEELIEYLLECLEIPEEDLFSMLALESDVNIATYDYALKVVRQKTRGISK